MSDYSELVKRLTYRVDTMNGARPVGAGDACTSIVGYYGPECAKDDAEAAAAILALTKRVKELETALERQATAWNNTIELHIISDQHRSSAALLRDEARLALSGKGE